MPTRRSCSYVVLLAMGCGRQVSAVEPGDTLYYRFPDRTTTNGEAIYAYRSIKDRTEVLVGLALEVDGEFAASCSYSTTPLGRDDDASKWPREIRSCEEQPTDVVVSCRGACAVEGRRVTPTAPGKLTVEVALTSRESGRRAGFAHELVAVEAEDFELGCYGGPVATSDGVRCRATEARAAVKIRAGEATFAAPIVANGEVFDARQEGATIYLARLFGFAPSSPFMPAPGEYVVELVFGSMRRVVTFEVVD